MSKKVSWVQIVIVLIGMLLGSLLANLTQVQKIPYCAWLSYGYDFSMSPATVNLGFFHLTFGIGIDVCIGMLLGMIIAMIIARKVR